VLPTTAFGGHVLQGGVEEFKGDRFGGGAIMAFAAGLGQLGIRFLAHRRALVPMAAAAAIGVMTVTVAVKAKNGL
jgi:hypothetical protein